MSIGKPKDARTQIKYNQGVAQWQLDGRISMVQPPGKGF